MSVSPNKPGEITGSWTDITRLKESETRFQELFEKAPIGYHSLDENGRLLAVNDTWREVFGYAGEEVLGRSFMEFLAPEERDRFKNNFTAFKLSGKVTDIEYDILRKNGSRGRIKLSARIAHNQDGSFRQTHGIFSDISATWEIERRTKILNEAIKASFNEIYIFDAETFRFIFVNQSALKNLGYSHKEMEELAPWDIKREFQEETFKAAVAPLLKKNQDILLLETVHTRKSGSSYPVEIRLQRIESPDAQVFLAVVNDITERKKSEALITEMTNMQRVESLGALAGGIAHDFNNMLTGIMANLSLLAARKDCGQESTAIIRDTLEASRSAQTLTTQLLAFAKGGKPVKKEFCFDKAITEIVSLATRGAKAAHETEIEAPLWSVNGDENQLKQSLNNLLVNALQAMPDGGTLRVRAANVTLGENTGRLLPPGPYIKVLVSDTGTGIPNEYLNRIFEPYFTTKSRGHGLGLSTTWSVIKNHGGHIEVRSEPGKGSTFEMLLPATGRVLSTAPSVSPEIKKGAGRILILEDEEIVRKAAARMLEELGYSCEITPDGAETLRRYAEEKAAGRPFDAVIMDLTIPGGMGGKDAGPQLRKMDPQARIVVSSGYSDEAVMADYRNFGFDEVLPKPYRYEELAEVLARVTKK
jgi:PAS domain S-box-containing protein